MKNGMKPLRNRKILENAQRYLLQLLNNVGAVRLRDIHDGTSQSDRRLRAMLGMSEAGCDTWYVLIYAIMDLASLGLITWPNSQEDIIDTRCEITDSGREFIKTLDRILDARCEFIWIE